MKADFSTLSAVLSLLANSAVLAALAGVLKDTDVTKLVEDLKAAIGRSLEALPPSEEYVGSKRDELRRKLFSFPVIALHLAYVAILAVLAAILIAGPEKALPPGELAEPLSSVERRVYWTWLAINSLLYLVQGLLPTYRLWELSRQAAEWLKGHEKQCRRKAS